MPRRRNPENAAAIDETPQASAYAAEELDEAEDQAAAEAARLAQEAAAQPEPAPAEAEPEAPAQEADAPEQAPEPEEAEPVQEPEDEAEELEQPEQGQEIPPLSLRVRIHSEHPTDDIAATADVEINGICTIRNVKVKNDDYGLEVVMPRTKMPDTGRFRDACVFPRREMRSQFDMAVLSAYQQEMGMTQTQTQPEQEGGMGMHM